MCKFDIAWVGICKEPNVSGEEYCEAHLKLMCSSCGAKATRSCPETRGLVCGAPLCDNCEDAISFHGTNTTKHVKKIEQIYKPWYERTKEDNDKIEKDKLIYAMDAIVFELELLEAYSRLEKYKEATAILTLIRKRIDEKKELIYNVIKERYPSSVIPKKDISKLN